MSKDLLHLSLGVTLLSLCEQRGTCVFVGSKPESKTS